MAPRWITECRGVPPSVVTPTPATANPAAPTGTNGARLPNPTVGAAAVKRKKDTLDGAADGEVVTTQHWYVQRGSLCSRENDRESRAAIEFRLSRKSPQRPFFFSLGSTLFAPRATRKRTSSRTDDAPIVIFTTSRTLAVTI
ncbi:hypothetical protein HZH66_009245 [Vespula vulgaris]|uniref:Uncharacterized protein n=1 Tax=Vespula vulgaris TaxID=7454 RepID=A0A834MZ64_VESVU|nr:hypothetical protein HZH66_009245 [Vespula vulgaris]